MEFRRLLSATIFGIIGADTANEGQNYTLNLSGVGPGASSVDHWAINWGDGSAVQNVNGFPSSVAHAYPDGPAGATITADVITTNGAVYHARNGPPINPADLDTTFGTGGMTTVPAPNAAALAVQADGKLLVAGSVQNAIGGYNFAVTRYNADGTLDTSFGAGGTTTVAFFHNNYQQDAHADALLVLPGGKILVGGMANYAFADPSSGAGMALARLNPDGSIDSSYGSGGTGTQQLWIGQNYTFYYDNITSLAQQPDGKVVAGGWERSDTFYGSSYHFAVARFNADGTPDLGFGGSGIAANTTDCPGTVQDIPTSIALQPDGKILLGGSGDAEMEIARYTSAGVPDVTFASGGFFLDAAGGQGRSVAVQADGKIVLAGDDAAGGSAQVKLIRLNADGSPDGGFGLGGRVLTWLGIVARGAFGLSAGADGKLLVAAGANPTMFSHDFTLLQYNPNGSLDPDFGAGGVATVDGGSDDVGVAMNLAPDGKIVVLGTAGFGDPQNHIGPANAELLRFQGVPPPKSIQVLNVAPAPSIGGLPTGGGSEGVPITLTASATDGPLDQAAGFGYAWTVTKNGAAYAAGTGAGLTFTPDDNGAYTVTLTATDRDGATGAAQQTLNVANVAPATSVGGLPAGNTMGEGTPVTLTASATDVALDQAAGFTVAWNVLKDGVAFGSGSGAAYTFRPDDNGVYYVACTVTDKDGGAATISQNIIVTNTNPTASLAAPAPAVRGQAVALTGSFTDPGLIDTHTAHWDFGDDTPGVDIANADTSLATTHVYTDAGTYTVTLTVTDKDGGATSVTRVVTADIADLQTNPNDPTKTDLVIGGTSGDDTISVSGAFGPQQVTVNGVVIGTFNPTARIVIYGYVGADMETVDAADTLPAYLDGGAGNDWLSGGAGADTFVGGADYDEANFTNHAAGVRVTMDGQANDGSNGGNEHDNVGSDIEVVAATGYDDYLDASLLTTPIVLNGYGGNNTLVGGSGNDALYGDAGNDTFYGNAGDDTFYAGAGNDLVFAGDGNDTVYGQAGDDAMTGDAGDDYVYGGDGNDALYGGLGADHVYGENGDDALVGEAIDASGDGAGDVFSGGAGNDAVTYAGRTAAVSISLDGVANDGQAGENDNVAPDVERLYGGGGNDTLVGGNNADGLYGNAGNDTIVGNGGNDDLQGGDGNDVIYGGDGNDTIQGQAGDDQMTGDAGDDYVYGGDGNDTLYGGLGTDHIYGENGDDTVYAENIDANGDSILDGDGNGDVFSGGAGVNNFGYTTRTAAVSISNDGAANDGEAGENDNVGTDFQRLYGGAGNDTITGGNNAEGLYGNGGNDTIYGNGGNDDLGGGDGNDKLLGGSGADNLSGGAGTDEVNFGSEPSGVTVTLDNQANDGITGESDNVRSDFEIVACTDYADVVDASGLSSPITINTYNGADRITGGSGNDILYGGDANDIITGGGGSDTFYGEGGNDTLNARDGTDDARIDGGLGTDTAQVDASPKDRNQIGIETLAP